MARSGRNLLLWMRIIIIIHVKGSLFMAREMTKGRYTCLS